MMKIVFFWLNLAHLDLCGNNTANRVSNHTQYFKEVNIEGFDFYYGFKCSDLYRFEKLNI